MDNFISDRNGITKTITKEIVQHYDYAELLETRKNLQLKLDDVNILIAECEKLGVVLEKEEQLGVKLEAVSEL